MAEIPSLYRPVFLFALIACHAFISAEGRQIKSMNKKEATAVKKEFQRKTHEGSSINSNQSAAERKEDFHPLKPGRDHITSAEHNIPGKKEIFPPISFGDVAAVYKDDFRPTTPGNSPGVGHKHGKVEEDDFRPTTTGNSPGVGHKHAEEEEDVESKVPDDNSLSSAEQSLTGFQNDFRPTAPGHSPGVGHSLSNKKAEPKA